MTTIRDRGFLEWHAGRQWVTCPHCGKRQFPVTPMTRIQHLWYKCKRCKEEMLIDIQE